MRFLFTVDVERDPFEEGETTFVGVEEGLQKISDSLRDVGIRATMFFSGEVAVRYPELLTAAHRAGHEIGCHGHDHSLSYLNRCPVEIVRDDLRRGRRAIFDVTGTPPSSFRAPNFSVNPRVLREIKLAGFDIDSSVLPGRVVRRWRLATLVNHRGAPSRPYRPSEHDHRRPGGSGILEVPLSSNPVSPGTPLGLGFLNARGLDAALGALNGLHEDYLMFLAHPWEAADIASHRREPPAWLQSACQPSTKVLSRFLRRVVHELAPAMVSEIAHEALGREAPP